MKRLLFLDFDGVVMTAESYERARGGTSSDTETLASSRLDPALVARVSTLCLGAEADIVLSTSWRGTGEDDRAALERALWSRGLDHRIAVVGQTPHGEAQNTPGLWVPCARGAEIESWLNEHRPGWTRDRIVILDDDSDMEPLMDRHVRAGGFRDGGLSQAEADRALALLLAPREVA